MTRMTGGQALVKSLYREGVRVIFGVPGVQLYHALDPLIDQPDIRYIVPRHEQAAANMAYGYSMAGGDIGTVLVVPGPGLQNASSGVGTAYSASCPMMVVAGQIDRDMIGRNRGMLHEIDDQLTTIAPVTKWASRVLSPVDIPGAVNEAFLQIKTGRPRPVEIEIPPDTLADTGDIELLEPAKREHQAPDRQSVQEAARLLAASTNTLTWAGGGAIASGASEALLKLAETLQAPVATTGEGKGAISDRHYLSMGAANYRPDALDRFMEGCDLILAVGTRLVRANQPEGVRVIQIDIDPEEIGRNHPNTLGVVGDARVVLEELHRLITPSIAPRASRQEELQAFKRARFEPIFRVEPQNSFVRAIRAAMPDDGILVEGITQVGYACHVCYPVYTPRSYITSSYFGNLGYTYPTALGAKVARPDRAVVAVSGDGGFLYNSQELATAVKYGINAVVIVFNDNTYGNILRDQTSIFDGRTIGADLHNPDFMKLADAYGARGVRARDAVELEYTLREALGADAPCLIEVPVGPMPAIWEDEVAVTST